MFERTKQLTLCDQKLIHVSSSDPEWKRLHSENNHSIITASKISNIVGQGYESANQCFEEFVGNRTKRVVEEGSFLWNAQNYGNEKEKELKEMIRSHMQEEDFFVISPGLCFYNDFIAATSDDILWLKSRKGSGFIFPINVEYKASYYAKTRQNEIEEIKKNENFSAEDIPKKYLIQTTIQMGCWDIRHTLLVIYREPYTFYIYVPFDEGFFQHLVKEADTFLKCVKMDQNIYKRMTKDKLSITNSYLQKISKWCHIFKQLPDYFNHVSILDEIIYSP